MSWTDYWIERHRDQGPMYVAKGGRAESWRAQHERIAPLLDAAISVPAFPCDALLDFGCGAGRFAPVLAERAGRYVGADIVAGALYGAPRLANAEYVHLTGEELPFGDGAFDVVTALTVLQHIVHPGDFALACAEIGRVLRPGGILVVWDAWPREGMGAHMRPRGPRRIASAAGTGPFQVTDLGDGHWFGVAGRQ